MDNPNGKIGVMIVEDDIDFIFLIKETLLGAPEIEFLGYAGNKTQAVEMAIKLRPAVVLMDLSLSGPDMDGIEAAREIRLQTSAKIIILSSHEDERTVIDASTKCFASNYIYKSNYEAIVSGIMETARGRSVTELFIFGQITAALTVAEKTVFLHMLGDNTPLKSAQKTIANQKTKIFEKLGVKNQKELVHIFSNYH